MRETRVAVTHGLLFICFTLLMVPSADGEPLARREALIPVLAVTSTESPTGAILSLVVAVEIRADRSGLQLQFRETPGRFSVLAQHSLEQAIRRTAQVLNLSTDSWTVTLVVPYDGVTVHGDSLSAMVGLSVVALTQGASIRRDMVLTGTITSQGTIGKVSGIVSKIRVAAQAHLRAVMIPREQSETYFSYAGNDPIAVLPVESVGYAYEVMTSYSPQPK